METKKRRLHPVGSAAAFKKPLIQFKGGLDKSQIRATSGELGELTTKRIVKDQTGGYHHFHGRLKNQ